MKKIGILLTSSATKEAVIEHISKPLKNTFTECITVNDDILELIRSNKQEDVRKLVVQEIRRFKDKGIYNIIFACSSISHLKDIAVQENVRIFGIDDFVEKETQSFEKVAFLATAPSALENSGNLFTPSQIVEDHLVDNAFECLLAGEKEKHNELIANYAESLSKDIQCIVLAQISMTYALDNILKKVDIPVFSGATTLVKNLLSQKKPAGVELYDSISYIKKDDNNKFIVSGSHGGIPSVEYAIDKKVFGAVFNDAGVGKNKAGISGLSVLQDNGILGVTVKADSAEIGNAEDTYENGIVSYFNDIARDYGVQKNMKIKDLVQNLT